MKTEAKEESLKTYFRYLFGITAFFGMFGTNVVAWAGPHTLKSTVGGIGFLLFTAICLVGFMTNERLPEQEVQAAKTED